MFSHGGWAQEELDALLDGLHRDAHEGNFQTYFAPTARMPSFWEQIKVSAGP